MIKGLSQQKAPFIFQKNDSLSVFFGQAKSLSIYSDYSVSSSSSLPIITFPPPGPRLSRV